jgi:hypothetical protein
VPTATCPNVLVENPCLQSGAIVGIQNVDEEVQVLTANYNQPNWNGAASSDPSNANFGWKKALAMRKSTVTVSVPERL